MGALAKVQRFMSACMVWLGSQVMCHLSEGFDLSLFTCFAWLIARRQNFVYLILAALWRSEPVHVAEGCFQGD